MTKIEWTDRTWNPTTGCNKVSPGCKNCYAEVMHKRLIGMQRKTTPSYIKQKYFKNFSEGVEMHEHTLIQPLRWKKPQRIFVNSMSDLFHEDVSFAFISQVFKTMFLAKHYGHTFQILTKRPKRMMEFVKFMIASSYVADVVPYEQAASHIWLGVSCENQQTADERIPFLLQTPAAVRFLSCEPLLGPVILSDSEESPHSIDWVICGGESGSNARPMHPDWARSLRDQCKAAGVPFFFKQWGNWVDADTEPYRFLRFQLLQSAPSKYKKWAKHNMKEVGGISMMNVGKKAAGHLLDGVEHRAFPKTEKLQPA